METLTATAKENAEKEFWATSEYESPQAESIGNIVNKMTDCGVFLSILDKYGCYFRHAGKVLELGGGQGWASCTLKKLFPDLTIALTDISEHAIQSLNKWEHFFDVTISEAYSCTSYATREADSSLDTVFCFAAAHHFTRWNRTMQELYRILKPGGHCFFFHEPACTRILHPFAYRRVNRLRSVVPEDVLIYKELMHMADQAGFLATIDFNPTTIKRGPVETIYYSILSKSHLSQKILPCTANFHLVKPRLQPRLQP